MKKHDPLSLAFLASITAFVIVGLCGGCTTSAGGKRTFAPLVTRTNVVEILATNTAPQVVEAIATTSDGKKEVIRATNFVSVVTTNWQTNIVTEVNPGWTSTISTARTLNETLNPTPSAPFVNIGLSALSGGLAWFAAWQNRRRAKATGLLNTVIAGVEAAKNPDVKAAIAETSRLWGNRHDLALHVEAVTGPGPNPA